MLGGWYTIANFSSPGKEFNDTYTSMILSARALRDGDDTRTKQKPKKTLFTQQEERREGKFCVKALSLIFSTPLFYTYKVQ